MTTTINPRLLAQDTLTNVEAHGGSTLSLVAGVGTPRSGYVVSLAGHEKRFQRFKNGPISRNFVEYYIDAHRAVLAQPGRYLGAWVFEGDLYLDVSEVHTEIKTAVELGVQRQQLAIWHIDSDCEISLTLGRRTTLYNAQQAADQILRDIRDAGQTTPDPETVGAPSVFEVIGHGLYEVQGNRLTFRSDLEGATDEVLTFSLAEVRDGTGWPDGVRFRIA